MSRICQSCGMPMQKKADFGTNPNNTQSFKFCVYCYQKGRFTKKITMEEQIEENLIHLKEFNESNNLNYNEEEARKEMLSFFPTLKRWKEKA